MLEGRQSLGTIKLLKGLFVQEPRQQAAPGGGALRRHTEADQDAQQHDHS
ncbi:MAG: hypothetical protein ACJ8H8_06655 [Geminicoccaceae bacterium]